MRLLRVTVEADGRQPATTTIDRSPCRIGRGPDVDLALPGWRVGRLHGEAHFDSDAVRFADGGTLAGTRLNGERMVGSAVLHDADLVEIGGYRLRFAVISRVDRGPAADGAGRDDADARAAAQGVAPSPREHPSPVIGAAASERADASLKRLLHRQLLQALDLRRQDLREMDPQSLRLAVRNVVEEILSGMDGVPSGDTRMQLVADLLDEALGLGPLERLLDDPLVGEIMVNAADDIWVERQGRLYRHAGSFSDDDAVRNIIDRIVAPLGRRIDEASPMVDARLPDGSRVNAVIPPLAVRGPALTIRRFARSLVTPEDLCRLGSASRAMLDFLKVCVESRRNIVVSGGTGSGKTTLLNILSNLIPAGERIITIEDSVELSLQHEHLVQLEARPPNLEGKGEVSIRDLVRNALRMRPDRIIVGECRGGETLDMLQAMNTGHDGSLTTVHANGAREVVSRLEVMTLMSGVDLPVAAIREQIASAVDIVVHQARHSDGSRRIASVMEVTGLEAGRLQMLELFRHDPSGGSGGCDAIPTFYESLRAKGVEVDLGIFARGQA
jgi:pilus assembly protein CpaF